MEKQKIYYIIAAVIIIIIIIAGLYVLTNEKGKFIGTWKYSLGSITFNDDNTATFGGDILGDITIIYLSGTINYKIANQQVIFTAGPGSVTLGYTFLDSNTLKLTNNGGYSITLTKE